MHTTPLLTTGTRVTGVYCGATITGTIVATRANTMNWSQHLTDVALDEPTIVFGTPRTEVRITTLIDGQPIPGDTDHLVAA